MFSSIEAMISEHTRTKALEEEISRRKVKLRMGQCWYCEVKLTEHKCKFADGLRHPELKKQNFDASEDKTLKVAGKEFSMRLRLQRIPTNKRGTT